MSAGTPGPEPELQPLVARPDDVRHFRHERRAGVADVTPSGRLRLDSIARWVQDVAWADVEDAGLRELTLWLVRRTRIRVRRFPRLDERCSLTTYVTGLGRMWAERRTDIVVEGAAGAAGAPGTPGASGVAGVAGVEVSCIWVHLDPERLLPSPVDPIEIETWCGPSTREVKARLRHPAPPPDAAQRPWTFRASELDIAAHVNNAAYLTPLDDELLGPEGAAPDPASVDLELEYRVPGQAGEKRLLSDGGRRWIRDLASGEVNASVVLADWPA